MHAPNLGSGQGLSQEGVGRSVSLLPWSASPAPLGVADPMPEVKPSLLPAGQALLVPAAPTGLGPVSAGLAGCGALPDLLPVGHGSLVSAGPAGVNALPGALAGIGGLPGVPPAGHALLVPASPAGLNPVLPSVAGAGALCYGLPPPLLLAAAPGPAHGALGPGLSLGAVQAALVGAPWGGFLSASGLALPCAVVGRGGVDGGALSSTVPVVRPDGEGSARHASERSLSQALPATSVPGMTPCLPGAGDPPMLVLGGAPALPAVGAGVLLPAPSTSPVGPALPSTGVHAPIRVAGLPSSASEAASVSEPSGQSEGLLHMDAMSLGFSELQAYFTVRLWLCGCVCFCLWVTEDLSWEALVCMWCVGCMSVVAFALGVFLGALLVFWVVCVHPPGRMSVVCLVYLDCASEWCFISVVLSDAIQRCGFPVACEPDELEEAVPGPWHPAVALPQAAVHCDPAAGSHTGMVRCACNVFVFVFLFVCLCVCECCLCVHGLLG